jgi:hypothetical protein
MNPLTLCNHPVFTQHFIFLVWTGFCIAGGAVIGLMLAKKREKS